MNVEQLQSFKGIGDAIAPRIVAERTTNGPFKNWEDLKKRVKLVPDTLKDYVTF